MSKTIKDAVEISVVVPVHNEAGNVEALMSEIDQALSGRAYEAVFVDDASTDGTRTALIGLRDRFPALRIVGHRTNAGQSRAIHNGVLAARGRLVGTLDGDGQNDPADLPEMFRLLNRTDAPERLAFIQGRRVKRKDTAWKRYGSQIANAVRQRLLSDGTDDSGCGIKVFKREAFVGLPYFDHMHRYMAALMKADGWATEFIEVNHRPRGAGTSKYTNFGRLWAAIADLTGVFWLIRRRRDFGGVDSL